MTKKLVSLFLALVITISCFPASVFAIENSISAYVNTDSVISVESVSSFAGKTVDVKINISKNPGVAGARLNLFYDSALTLLSVSEEAGVFGILDYTAPSKLSSPTVFNWDSLDAVSTEDGTILVLTFEVSSSAKADDELDIILSYNYGDIYDVDLNSLSISTVSGSVKIIDYIPGDVNGDSVVNGKDVTLIRRYNANWDVDINTLAADVNNDGVINGKDVTLIRRYNANWDVELLPSTPKCNHNYIWVVDKEATQTSTGLKHERCSLCGNTRNENTVIPVVQHTHSLEYVAAVAATCTQNGNLAYWFCSSCDKYYSDINATKEIFLGETIIWPTGHSYQNGVCLKCGNKEYKPLVVSSVSADKTLLMAKETVTFHAVTNKDSSEVTLTVAIYLNGTKIDEISDTGDVVYVPTQAGRYDVEVSVTDGSDDVFTYSLKSCFDVKAYWALKNVTVNAYTASLGEKLTFSANVDGDPTDLDYEIAIYKNGSLYHSVEHVNTLEFSPSAAGTYYAVIFVTDSYGERQSALSKNIIVKAQSGTNPILNVNYGKTLNIDELNGKHGDEVIVPSGNITLVWNKNSTDSYYRVRITAHNDNDSYAVTAQNYTSTSYSIATGKLTPGNQYTVRLDRYDASGRVIGSTEKFEFTVGGASNSIMLEKRFDVISPVEDNVYMYDDITVQWTKLNYATKYVLSLEYDCGKSDHIVLDNIEISKTQNSYIIPKSALHQGCTHQLEVTAYDALGNELSESIEFRIEGDEALFEISKPEIIGSYFYEKWTGDMKTYPVYEDIVVTWENIPAAEYYAIAVESSYGNISDPVLTGATHIERNTFTIPINKLVSGCVYNIRVTVYCAEGHKLTSDRLYFRVPYANGTDLYGPQVTSHDFSKDANDPTSVVEQALTITWEPVSAAVSYDVYWREKGADYAEFEVKNIKTTTVTIPSQAVLSWGPDSDYELMICANTSNDLWEDSIYYVRVVESAVEAPVVVSPTLATENKGNLPSFDDAFTIKWNAVEGAAFYKVRISAYEDDDYYECYVEDNITSTSLELPVDELYFGGIFRITIRAYDYYGGSSKVNRYYFQLGESDYIGLSLDNWNPTHEADHKYISLNTVGAWTAQTSVSWITLDKVSGTGSDRVKINVSENTDNSARSGYVTFTNADGGVAVFSITQSNTSVIQITSPKQGAVLDRDVVTVKWTCKYGYHYFNLTLKDLTTNKDVYLENNILVKYQQIPAKYFEQGHTYQVTISQYYDYQKHSESSIVFKIDGDIIPSGGNNGSAGGDAGNNDGGSSGGNTGTGTTTPACDHTFFKKEHIETTYTNLIKTYNVHDGYSIYNKVCMDCGESLGHDRVNFSNAAHQVNSKGYCECGFIYTNSASAWTTTNQSSSKVVVYQTPESTSKYGSINAGEEVKVLGECCGRYLIEYKLDDGTGVKQGYVNTNALGKATATYSIFINDEYLNAPIGTMVAEKNTVYKIYIQNNSTGDLLSYGTDGLICESSDPSVVDISSSGVMTIRNVGSSVVRLMHNGKLEETLDVIGCTGETLVTNYSAMKESVLIEDGFAPNCRLRVYNYESMFINDSSKEGGGYYRVTFDVYNDVPTIFSVAAIDKYGNIQKQVLINGYTDGMVDEMISAFWHITDLLDGSLIRGESEMYSTKTHVSLDVPLGGYVDFLSLNNSTYMVYANVLSGIVVGAMETADAWTSLVKVASTELHFDPVKFGERLMDKLIELTGMTQTDITAKVVGILLKAEWSDLASIATEIMGFLYDSGVTLETLFVVLNECVTDNLPGFINGAIDTSIDVALTVIPPAKIIKKFTDAAVSSLQYVILIKDLSSMITRESDFMIIVYPNEAIIG